MNFIFVQFLFEILFFLSSFNFVLFKWMIYKTFLITHFHHFFQTHFFVCFCGKNTHKNTKNNERSENAEKNSNIGENKKVRYIKYISNITK